MEKTKINDGATERRILESRYCFYFSNVRLEFKEEMLRKKYEEETGSLAEERMRQEMEEHRGLMKLNRQENVRLLELR